MGEKNNNPVPLYFSSLLWPAHGPGNGPAQPLLLGRLASSEEELKTYWCLMELLTSSPCKSFIGFVPSGHLTCTGLVRGPRAWGAEEFRVLGWLSWGASFGSLGKELSRGHPRVAWRNSGTPCVASGKSLELCEVQVLPW